MTSSERRWSCLPFLCCWAGGSERLRFQTGSGQWGYSQLCWLSRSLLWLNNSLHRPQPPSAAAAAGIQWSSYFLNSPPSGHQWESAAPVTLFKWILIDYDIMTHGYFGIFNMFNDFVTHWRRFHPHHTCCQCGFGHIMVTCSYTICIV